MEENNKLKEQDKHALDLAKTNKKIATLNAEKAVTQNELAELQYKYIVLQIYMKYGLSPKDGIDEDGNIIKASDSNENI